MRHARAAWRFARTLPVVVIALPISFTARLPPLLAQETSLISFELEDQFDKVHRNADYEGKIVIVIGSDRDGSEFNERWGEALHAELEGEPGYERIVFLPVAEVTGVPFFMKGIVKGQFPKEPEQWALIDWEGAFAEAYEFVPGWTNILIFTPQGRLAHRTYGQEIDADVLHGIVTSTRVLLARSG